MRGRAAGYRHSVADVGTTSAAMREIVLASQGDAPSNDLLADICRVVSRSFEFERVAVGRYHERLGEVAPVAVVGETAGGIPPPLPSVYGISVTLDERNDALSDPERRQLRRALREQSERLRALVDQLLDLSRFDVAEVEISPTPTPLASKLHELVELVAPEQQVAVEADPQLTGWVDPLALDRIVSNLLSNALRYGRLPITISATGGETHLRLAVEDRGAGVGDDFVPRLFERFSRSENSMHDVAGSGLGLAIAREKRSNR